MGRLDVLNSSAKQHGSTSSILSVRKGMPNPENTSNPLKAEVCDEFDPHSLNNLCLQNSWIRKGIASLERCRGRSEGGRLTWRRR